MATSDEKLVALEHKHARLAEKLEQPNLHRTTTRLARERMEKQLAELARKIVAKRSPVKLPAAKKPRPSQARILSEERCDDTDDDD